MLDLILYSGLPSYWYQYVSIWKVRGFYVHIHNHTDYPYNLAPSPILLTPGLGTRIVLSRSFYEQFNEWPYAYSECRVNGENELIGPPLDDPSLFEQVIATNYSYSRSTCNLFCAQLETTKACGCNNFKLPNPIEEYDLCTSPDQKKCADDFLHFIFNKEDFIQENCLPKCPLECSQREMKTSFSYYKYPTIDQAPEWQTKYPELKAKYENEQDFDFGLYNNLVRVSIYYDTLSYTVSEEKAAMSLENLIGLLGGHLHLFLGMSWLSFFELIELAVEFTLLLKKGRAVNIRRLKIQPLKTPINNNC